ncbi:hypothetical protein [Nannocystis exedens]|uniref:hypothetical protein n=1 Tax=Nannocystis exedens TaxID=54 RepID=UPI00116066DA|nr:hypothetical protein [Nannocystis exedens]
MLDAADLTRAIAQARGGRVVCRALERDDPAAASDLPDDDFADLLRGELLSAAPAAKQADPFAQALADLARIVDLPGRPFPWVEADPAAARSSVVGLLMRGIYDDDARMPLATAEALAARFFAGFGDRARCFWRAHGHPLAGAIVEHVLAVVDPRRAALLALLDDGPRRD